MIGWLCDLTTTACASSRRHVRRRGSDHDLVQQICGFALIGGQPREPQRRAVRLMASGGARKREAGAFLRPLHGLHRRRRHHEQCRRQDNLFGASGPYCYGRAPFDWGATAPQRVRSNPRNEACELNDNATDDVSGPWSSPRAACRPSAVALRVSSRAWRHLRRRRRWDHGSHAIEAAHQLLRASDLQAGRASRGWPALASS
jgi:hypothetical protein